MGRYEKVRFEQCSHWTAVHCVIRALLILSRTVFAVYTYLNTLNVYFEEPPVLLNADVDMELPCSEDIWRAPTREVWRSRFSVENGGNTLSDALKGLLSDSHSGIPPAEPFASSIIMFAMLQLMWHMRRANCHFDPGKGLVSFKEPLRRWQADWEFRSGTYMLPHMPERMLAFNVNALLALANIRLCIDFGRIKTALTSGGLDTLDHALSETSEEIARTAAATNAAAMSVETLRMPVRLGLLRRSNVSAQPVPLHLFSLEQCMSPFSSDSTD